MNERQHPLKQLILARLREFWREPAAVFWVYFFPLIMVAALGSAFRSRPAELISIAVEDLPATQIALSAIQGDERFQVEAVSPDESKKLLRTGKVSLIVGAADDKGYDYYYDPTNPDSLLARNTVEDLLQRAAGRKDVFKSRRHELQEPSGRYIDFLVPGLLGMGLMGGGMWGVGFAIVDLRIRKLLKRYLATPMSRSHFLLGVMISRLLFTLPEVFILLLFARFAFGVVVYGSYLAVGVLIVLGAFQFAGIGLLIASRAQTLETVSGLMNAAMVPMWICSGIFFSPDRFPDFVQPIIRIMPLTPLIGALRRVMVEGAGLFDLPLELTIIGMWGMVTFGVALRFFRWS